VISSFADRVFIYLIPVMLRFYEVVCLLLTSQYEVMLTPLNAGRVFEKFQ
jgi:hypothetical protein